MDGSRARVVAKAKATGQECSSHDEECAQSVEIVGAAWPSVIVSQVTNIRSLADISDVRVPVRIERNLSEHA